MASQNKSLPDYNDILDAERILDGLINVTPVDLSKGFSEQFGCRVYFKLENMQKTGSFKARGAIVKLSHLTEDEKDHGVITASAGNHAQGVAYAAKMINVKAKIIMPEYTTPAKINAVEGYGAEIILHGKDYNEAREYCIDLVRTENMTFIDGFNDRWIIAGQGTIGKEIMNQVPDADIIVVPVGGGGLISGIAIAAKKIKPTVKIIGVQSEKVDSMKKSLEEGRIVSSVSGDTIADGIAIRYPGDMTFEIVKKYVDRIVTVSDESIATALFKMLERNKTVVEPAGASGLAALMENKIDVKGKNVVIVLSGGNINLLLLSKIIFKSMHREWDLVRIDFKIPDRPGTLYRIASLISEAGGNIYHAEVDNLNEDTPVGYQSVTFTVNVRGKEHADRLTEKLKTLGYRFTVLKSN